MSYQLVNAKSAAAPSGAALQLCTIAAGSATPPALADALCRLSHKLYHHYPQTHQCIFSHRILTCDTQTYHILSVASHHPQAPDYCFLCHHTALTEQEALALKRNNARPTPAGIIYALLASNNYWHTSPTAALPDPELTPILSAAQLPDAQAQPTWKAVTGHKRNAAALLTPPYTGPCLICCPEQVDAPQRLLLLHEAMWLMPSRGWDKTFCTECSGQTADFLVTEIILTTAQSPQAIAITDTQSIPTLQIFRGLTLNTQESAESLSSIAYPISANPQPQVATYATGATHNGTDIYKYTEAPDHECFDIPPPTKWRSYQYIAVLFVLAAAIYLGVSQFASIFSSAPPAVASAHKPFAQDAIAQFRHLIRSNSATDDELRKLLASFPANQRPIHATAAECIRLLTTDVHKTHGHAENLLFLAAQAKTLQLPVADLTRFYLLRAIKDYPVDEWVCHNTTVTATAAWHKLRSSHPAVVQQLTADPRLHAHLAPLFPRFPQ